MRRILYPLPGTRPAAISSLNPLVPLVPLDPLDPLDPAVVPVTEARAVPLRGSSPSALRLSPGDTEDREDREDRTDAAMEALVRGIRS